MIAPDVRPLLLIGRRTNGDAIRRRPPLQIFQLGREDIHTVAVLLRLGSAQTAPSPGHSFPKNGGKITHHASHGHLIKLASISNC